MKLKIADERTLQFDDAQILFKNFSGKEGTYNKAGDRNFAIKIDPEFISQLQNSKNKEGAAWNVKVFTPKADEANPKKDTTPINYLKVKIGKNPVPILIETDGKVSKCLDMNTLDNIHIEKADIDIQAYDAIVTGKSYRSAYLKGMKVYAKANSRFDTMSTDDSVEASQVDNSSYENLNNVEEVPF